MKTRSLFWPLTLITIGILWLLGMTNTIPLSNLWALAHLVPFALIAIGIGLLVRSVWPAGGMVVSILVVAGIILAVVFAPQLGWNDMPSWAFNWGIGENTGGGTPGSGNIASVSQDASGVDTIEINYPSEVLIQQGDVETVSVEGDDNLLPQINTRVVNGRLEIRNTESDWSERVRPTQEIQVTITVKDLRQVQFSTAGSLRLVGIEADDLDIQISGVGDVRLEDINVGDLNYQISGVGNTTADGMAQTLDLQLSGLGDFDAEDLSLQSAEVSLSGAGSTTLWVSDELRAEISGAGSLNYYGDPTVTRQVTGAGSINSKGDK